MLCHDNLLSVSLTALLFLSLPTNSPKTKSYWLDQSHLLLYLGYLYYLIELFCQAISQTTKLAIETHPCSCGHGGGSHSCDSKHGDHYLTNPSENGLKYGRQVFLRSPRREKVYKVSTLFVLKGSFMYLHRYYICFRYCLEF